MTSDIVKDLKNRTLMPNIKKTSTNQWYVSCFLECRDYRDNDSGWRTEVLSATNKQLYYTTFAYSFLFQWDVTRSLNRYECPVQTLYWPKAYNSESTVSVYWIWQISFCNYIGKVLQHTSYDKWDRFLIRKNSMGLVYNCLNGLFVGW